MTNIRHSMVWAFGTKYALMVVQFISTVFIARLVTPDDIGIYTVAAVFIGLGQLIREFGVNRYIIQESDLTSDRIRAASTLNLMFGWGAGVVVFMASWVVGGFYGRAEVQEVMQLLSINFLFVPFGAITFAFLRREMRFREMMWIQVLSAIVGASVGIATAWHGEGYRALVWSAIAGTLTTVALCQVFRPKAVSLKPGFREIGHVFRFCRYAGSDSILSHLNSSAPDLILGKVLGMQMVGLFSRAAGTIAMFNSVVLDGLASVVLPYFSKALREGKETRTAYAHAVGCITGLAWPFFAILGLLAAPIIETLFGSQWREVVPLVQLMCLGACVIALFSISSDVLTALGQVRAVFHINLTVTSVKIILIMLTAMYGLLVVVAALQIVAVLRLVLVNRQISRHVGLRLRDIWKPLLMNIVLGLISVVPPIIGIVLYGWTLEYSIPHLLVILTISALAWLSAIYVLKPPLYLEIHPIMLRIKQILPTQLNR
ncbi:MAG: lipopolysaccharide biosynthesis protein [Thiobacillus sp.]